MTKKNITKLKTMFDQTKTGRERTHKNKKQENGMADCSENSKVVHGSSTTSLTMKHMETIISTRATFL